MINSKELMIHSLIIAVINYILRVLMIFVLLYLYVTINRIHEIYLSESRAQEFDICIYVADSHDSSCSLIIIRIYAYIVPSYLHAPRMRCAVGCGRQDVKIPRRVAARSTNSVVVACEPWYLVSYNRTTLYTIKRATWQSVSYNIHIFDIISEIFYLNFLIIFLIYIIRIWFVLHIIPIASCIL